MAATRRIEYTPDTPAQAESEKYNRKVPRKRADVKKDHKSNGSVAAPIKGRKLRGGADINGNSV